MYFISRCLFTAYSHLFVVRKDLLTTFHRLFAHEAFAQLDWIVIETTGMHALCTVLSIFFFISEVFATSPHGHVFNISGSSFCRHG